MEVLRKFEGSNYTNKWVHKKRNFRKQGLKAALDCSMTTSGFELFLEVESSTGAFVRRCLLRTDPDELAFGYQFKDLLLEGDELVVSSKFGTQLFRSSLTELWAEQDVPPKSDRAGG